MLNGIIRFSLQNRLLVIAIALFLLGYGAWQASQLPIDVFPNLNRPRVVVMTEAPGMAPEEVETLITFPIETVLNGATGVQAVRTSSGIGLSVVYVEFDWGTDIYNDRQIVAERLALATETLPPRVKPQLMPISSIMGQIMMIGMTADADTTPMQLRTLADWVVRQRLLTIPGVSQVIVMGGERKQFQVLVDPDKLLRFGVSLHEVKIALKQSNQNTAGGYLDEQGPNEFLVRSLGRVKSVREIGDIVVKQRDRQSVTLSQVARIVEGAQVKRGDSSAFTRNASGEMTGGTAVVLTILKQPQADTREVTKRVTDALEEMQETLPADVHILPELYQQEEFIDLAIENVVEALRDGAVLVVIILFLFLMNVRTTLITLTAIPLSLAVTAIVFAAFGLSVNTMTLGGLAVAIGELVDDAIVDVENIFRRLRENRHAESPLHPLLVVFKASVEIRNSIVYGTIIVMLVFVPLFALSGMEGRLFTPLGISYIVSIASSLLVSLTVTPVLSYWLLRGSSHPKEERDSFLLRWLKGVVGIMIRFSLRFAWQILAIAMIAVAISGWALLRLESDFLPPFNEGAVQINVLLPPGTSLATSNEVAARVEQRLGQLDDLTAFVRKTGRAELDEHAEGVNVSEIVATVNPTTKRSREEVIEEISEALADIPGIVTSVEQPLAHLISHMLSGVKAQVAIKLYGDDLDELRREAQRIQTTIADIPGVRDLQVEQQVIIPQLRIEADGEKLKAFGLRRGDVNEFVETAMQGEVVSQVLDGQRTFDLMVRLGEEFREDLDALKRLQIDLPGGGSVKLEDVARVYKAGGPNMVNREQVRRRIVVQCNVSGRGLVDVVDDIKERLRPLVAELPPGYFVEYGGQFESQQSASRLISILFALSLVGMFLVLYKMFHSANLALQVMIALPMAFIGSVASLYLTGQTLTVASMVGFISLCGIASRNGILLINHYLHLVKYEGETWTREMIVRAGKDRLAPVLMTALTSGIGLVPLALAAGEPGKEILYPVATVIIGGLVTSTLLEFLVRPALFWTTGMGSARRVVEEEQERVVLEVEED
ncbi:efflux RND transporter permease subunit [Bythopirellula polymerisocia]|uniref:Cobalt-zinc-cadmium resistance protein CzcA n=1 Tax=Bythopirellula polymerisocia TaxID=2528003 RepID=A0A5C6CRE2_9BACT|nr:efflux RND transporter permease subunit [Bythopirellula polymerisocia]TWU27483.1 Cobalt-zinc-cadmium resistance protein CzcA [Bythopirellula polymerisocia]